MKEREKRERRERERRSKKKKRSKMKTLKMVKEKRVAKGDREVPLTFASRIPKRAVSFEDGILAYFQGNSF